MGFFDIFKRKKETKEDAIAQLFKMFFPGGREEQIRLTKGLISKLGHKYDDGCIANNYVYVLSSLFNGSDKSLEAITDKVLKRPNNKLSKEDIKVIYDYSIQNNQKLSEIMSLMQAVYKMCEKGTDQDTIPEGTGEFGLEVSNPIPIKGVPESETYLKKLRLPNGEQVMWKRVCSCSAPNISSLIDDYEIFDKKGKTICHLYLCPYNRKTSTRRPKGFIFEGDSVHNPQITNQISGTILPEKTSSYVVDDNGEPKMVYKISGMEDVFSENPSKNDEFGYYLNIRKPYLVDYTDQKRVYIPNIPNGCDGAIIKGIGSTYQTWYKVKNSTSQAWKVLR